MCLCLCKSVVIGYRSHCLLSVIRIKQHRRLLYLACEQSLLASSMNKGFSITSACAGNHVPYKASILCLFMLMRKQNRRLFWGEMAEWLIASISKVDLALANEGSNPSFSILLLVVL